MTKHCKRFESPVGMSRRQFLNQFGMGLGGIALSDLLGSSGVHAATGRAESPLHHAAKAKRVIFLFQSGGPSQMDLYDYKPLLNEKHGEQLPDEIRRGQRLTAMSGNQASLPLVGSKTWR